MNRLLLGTVAGAAGTTFLNMATYLDVALRGRSSSGLPAKVAAALAKQLGFAAFADSEDETTANRRAGIGALLGYVNGIGLGTLHGAFHPVMRRLPVVVEGVLLGLGSMALSDVAAMKLRQTDPSTWSKDDWLTDLVPHLVYGVATAGTLRAVSSS